MADTLRDTDSDWRLVAEQDPYWGVLSAEEFRAGRLDETALTRFFASGQAHVADLFGLVQAHLRADFQPRRALDFGCGMGRLLLPLARLSGTAVGVDVAPRMLDLARQHAAAQGLGNVELALSTDDALSAVTGQFDLVNSYIVLQHIPPQRGYRLLRALLARLAPGGIGSLQVTYAKARRFLAHEAPAARYYRREGSQIMDLGSSEAPAHAPGTISVFDYDLNQVAVEIAEVSGSPILALPTRHDDHLGMHYVFQRAR